MQPADEDEKSKPQFPTQTQRWALGIAICLLGLGAWSYKKHGHELHRRGPSLPGLERPLPVLHGDGVADVAGPESLEDALGALEAGDGWASQGVHLPDSNLGLPTAKGKSKSKAVPRPAAKASQKGSKQKKAAKDDVAVATALDNLEAGSLPAPAGKKSKKSKTSQADKEKAQAILHDAFEKMTAMPEPEEDGGLGNLFGGNLKERLEELVKDEEERDRDPEIRKAKAILKDAIKKMDTNDKTKASEDSPTGEEAESLEGLDTSHMEFAQRLKEEAAMKHEHNLASVREEFKRDFGSESRRMLCSGCKLVAARLENELGAHDVHESDSPAAMIANKRKAIDATCHSLRHLHVIKGEGGPRFEVAESDGDAMEQRLGQKLCTAVLEDAKFEVLSRLIRRKVPATSLFHNPEPTSNNWERLLCAQRSRVCKRNEVREDEDAEEL